MAHFEGETSNRLFQTLQDIEDYRDLKTGKPSNLRDEYRKRSAQQEKERKPQPKRNKHRDRGHEPEIQRLLN